MHLKARLFALVLILVFAGLTWLGWHQLSADGSYSLKLAAFGPVGIVGGLFLLLFPTKIGKPETTFDKFFGTRGLRYRIVGRTLQLVSDGSGLLSPVVPSEIVNNVTTNVAVVTLFSNDENNFDTRALAAVRGRNGPG
jgi:hypothetical protein